MGEMTKEISKDRKGFNIKNTAGMYDLFKGVSMFVVIIVHTISLFPFYTAGELTGAAMIAHSVRISPLFFIYYLFTSTIMPGMFVVAGYGFRKTNIKQCIKRQFKSLMIPYLITMILTSIVHFVDHYLFYHYIPGALKETFKIFMGSLLGLAKTTNYGEITFFANGPNWFILALFWGLIIFDVLVTYVPEKALFAVSFCAALLGWLLSLGNTFPFCISQGLVSVLFIYFGYYVKKSKTFISGLTVKHWVIYIVVGVIPELVLTYLGDYVGMADDQYRFGIISILEKALFSVGFLYLFLLLNALRGPISMFIRRIGHNSIYILCIHTIEMMGFPLYYFANNWKKSMASGIITLSVLRLVVVFSLCFLFVAVKDRISNAIRNHWGKEYE